MASVSRDSSHQTVDVAATVTDALAGRVLQRQEVTWTLADFRRLESAEEPPDVSVWKSGDGGRQGGAEVRRSVQASAAARIFAVWGI